jgi:hypothetical protein
MHLPTRCVVPRRPNRIKACAVVRRGASRPVRHPCAQRGSRMRGCAHSACGRARPEVLREPATLAGVPVFIAAPLQWCGRCDARGAASTRRALSSLPGAARTPTSLRGRPSEPRVDARHPSCSYPCGTTIDGSSAASIPARQSADAAIALQVSPRVATEPATLTIRATVERHADNHGLHVRILSRGYCRSSFVQPDGLDASDGKWRRRQPDCAVDRRG